MINGGESPRLSALASAEICREAGLPLGVVDVVTGECDALARTLAEHDGVVALRYAGPPEGAAAVGKASAGRLKPVWVADGRARDWFDARVSQRPEHLRRVTQVKTVWISYEG